MNKNGIFFVLLSIFHIVYTDVILDTCNENKSPMVKLKRSLLCEYDSSVRPVKNNNNVTVVSFYLKPYFFEYTHEDQIFTLHAWMSMIWNDSHLTWEPSQNNNIDWMPISSYQIWVPDILIHNERIGESTSDYSRSKCWVSHQGIVKWLTAAKYSSSCVSDNTWWPYNIMNCTIQFGSWSHSDDEVKLYSHRNTTTVEIKNVEWDLVKLYMTRWENKYKYNSGSSVKMISYHFILRSNWSIINIIYLSPTIVLMVMTLMTLWLEPKSYERMVIANINFICHLLSIQDVHWEMPRSGFNTPKMLTFYEGSLGIATFALILTSILRYLQEVTTEPPVWISASTTSILRSRVGRILLVSILDPAATAKIEIDVDDNTDLVQSNGKRSPWKYIILLIGWLAFLSAVLAYIILLSTCYPTKYTMTY
ncbi:neuronal acetylcholine receptor subunit alpha-2 [Solenopsis invicta]|uniref:neuronal acetylcholine receptor subunit alpha-2 n=1 Tax=Solenopsis invicta TaxID=13686 RepID=UPI000595B414|nr:neuronal acetylcholine receptor subunit alpha-2 [Solenopsis invicta]